MVSRAVVPHDTTYLSSRCAPWVESLLTASSAFIHFQGSIWSLVGGCRRHSSLGIDDHTHLRTMAPIPDAINTEANTTNHPSSAPAGLSTSDVVGIAVGVPTAVLALMGLVIATLAWKYPKGSAAKIQNAILRRPKQIGTSWNSNVMYGGKQKAKNMTFESIGDMESPIQTRMNISNATTDNAEHVGDTFNCNVLHEGAKQEIDSMTFGTWNANTKA
ncbi:hypothetical protein QC764_210290 [Podospora pseudoanserina]|uniref:Uncharacterized protein n=1 Tax=Podospora pseudoanserina TaxID=2609844 RepID=A0ABR0IIX4_9PEZI|nr:hypothetical protein QC764_210290 [Podospora pseudoanserina]